MNQRLAQNIVFANKWSIILINGPKVIPKYFQTKQTNRLRHQMIESLEKSEVITRKQNILLGTKNSTLITLF